MPGFCCACGLEIGDGAEVAYRADLPPEAARVHKACEASPLRPAYAGRLATVVSLPPAAARRVASGMGLTVTRNKRYMPHLEVCFRAADAAVARARRPTRAGPRSWPAGPFQEQRRRPLARPSPAAARRRRS